MRLARLHMRRFRLKALPILCQLCSRSLRKPSSELQPIPLHTHSLTPLVCTVSMPTTPGRRPLPEVRVHRDSGYLTVFRVKEPAMMAKPAVPEKPRQHGQSARGESLIDIRLLSLERLDSGTTGQGFFASGRVGNFRIKLGDRPQSVRLAAIPAVERLAQNILATRRVVAKIEPVRDVARPRNQASLDHAAC